jgi:hypothetical protein
VKVEVRDAYEISAGKPEGQNINVMCEDQVRYEACTLNVHCGGSSDEQSLKIGIHNVFRKLFLFPSSELNVNCANWSHIIFVFLCGDVIS